jgi:hypothetical protein
VLQLKLSLQGRPELRKPAPIVVEERRLPALDAQPNLGGKQIEEDLGVLPQAGILLQQTLDASAGVGTPANPQFPVQPSQPIGAVWFRGGVRGLALGRFAHRFRSSQVS